jgi:PIN domain nuclease of toxin-antitoxin system
VSGVLLDTHALLWFIDDHSKLSATAIQRICEPGSELFFSYAGAWEIAIKYGNGKLMLPD